MSDLIELLQPLGTGSLDTFWLPVAVWSVAAVITTAFMHFKKGLAAATHIHIRTALLVSLPAGILLSTLWGGFSKLELSWSEEPAGTGGPVVIELLSNSGGDATLTALPANRFDLLQWLEPIAGGLLLVLLAISLIKIVQVFYQLDSLGKLHRGQRLTPASSLDSLSTANRQLIRRLPCTPGLIFVDTTQAPFAYGIRQPIIVLPASLRSDPVSLNMALHHELMHIQRHDFLPNMILLLIDSLFWFHPLARRLYRKTNMYREVICDQSVIADSGNSPKAYALLLYRFAQYGVQPRGACLCLSDQTSHLKERIQAMRRTPDLSASLPFSRILSVSVALLITLIAACTDIQNTDHPLPDDLTEQDLSRQQPLLVVDGEVMKDEMVSRQSLLLNSSTIKRIEILNQEDAVSRYGRIGNHGVILVERKNQYKHHSKHELFLVPRSGREPLNKLHMEILNGDAVLINSRQVPIDNLMDHILSLNIGLKTVIHLKVHTPVTVGTVTDVQKVLRKIGTFRINYSTGR